jgi:hypothetical protein
LICVIQIEGEEASRLSKKRLEREKARRDAAADLSEDLSEGEKGENINGSSVHDESTRERMPRIGSTDAIEVWANQHKDKKLYIVLIRYESYFIPACLLLGGSVITASNKDTYIVFVK